MSSNDPSPHSIFLINELLENILLHMDTRTLLTSAQRVSRTWNIMIKTSTKLQETLFFEPSKASNSNPTQRHRNPLLEDILWAQFLLKQQTSSSSSSSSSSNPTAVSRLPLHKSDHRNLKPFLRKTASWRQMLLQQPPTSSIGVLEIIKRSDSEFTKLAMNSGQFLRMSHIVALLDRSTLIPTRNKWILWTGRSSPLNFELWNPKWVYEPEPDTSQPGPESVPEHIDWDSLRLEVAGMYLDEYDCGVVIVSERRQVLFQAEDREHQLSGLDRRLEGVWGMCEVEVGRRLVSHSSVHVAGVGDENWRLRPCSATPLVPMYAASGSEGLDSASLVSGSVEGR
ncbi:uncharacterized protein N7515_009707 [Penicillium bovifimosum]|uniref:F-box domain-containing protein n=1 Tax=Penicillium bovifimosum TaxID=126998 RepID=A0A9W9GHE3_9EURO|nr:uncharacterized protein N7515_009707 [Penicillium bovifimosum]KAJ5120319.1 hypothetical protein N7515_009707 [Penicillium bovifimosum]